MPSPDLAAFDSTAKIGRLDLARIPTAKIGKLDLARIPVSTGDDVVETASKIRETLGFDIDERRRLPTWTDALRQADEAGILVMVSSVVGSNNRRKLRPEGFRGFALADPHAQNDVEVSRAVFTFQNSFRPADPIWYP